VGLLSDGCLDCECLADLILGKVDALEAAGFAVPGAEAVTAWYQLLNSGLHVPLVGGSRKRSNLLPLGCVRGYARLAAGAEFNYRNWIEGVRAGHTFVTNGPLISMTANDQGSGAVLDVPDSTPIRVHAEAHSLLPFERLEIVANGIAVAAAPVAGSPAGASLDAEVPLPEGGWLAARCYGEQRLPGTMLGQCVYAHTSPVSVRANGRPPRTDPAAVAGLIGHLDKMLQWVERQARCENERQREHLGGIFRSAREELARRRAAGGARQIP
jgi:TolB protein